jgi:hypothetical protein
MGGRKGASLCRIARRYRRYSHIGYLARRINQGVWRNARRPECADPQWLVAHAYSLRPVKI